MVGIVILIGLALIGLVVGSFLGVVIRRSGTRVGIIRGRSFCPRCRRTLRWFELFPILSFLAQGGRCRSCRQSIPFFYPAVEIITAVIFVVLGIAAGNSMLPPPPFAPDVLGGSGTLGGSAAWFLYYVFFALVGVIVSFHDFERRLIPLVPVRLAIIVGIGAQFFGLLKAGSIYFLLPTMAIAGGAFALFWSLWFFSRGRAMGRGDADVALAIGLYLGPSTAAWGLLLAFWIGAVTGIVLVLMGRLGMKSRIPFGPFLFGGALVSLCISTSWAALNPFLHVF